MFATYYYHYFLFRIFCTYLCDFFFHKKHTEIQSIISEHGAFPLVSVWVQHGEPGNLHPYNFEIPTCSLSISIAETYYY